MSSPWCNNSCCCRVLMVVFSKTCPEVSSPPSWLRCTSPDLVTWRCRGCDSSQTRTNRNDPSESRHRNAFLPRVAHQNLFDHLKNEKTSQSIIMLQTTVLHTSDYYNSTVSLALRGHQRPPPPSFGTTKRSAFITNAQSRFAKFFLAGVLGPSCLTRRT